MNCLFCKIIKKEISAEVIYEDGKNLAILDINPRTLGHTVIISKTHSRTILDLPKKEAGSLFEAVKKVTQLIKNSLNPEGFTIGINHGKISGQVIDHLHIHIMPRFRNDGGGSVQGVVNNPPKQSLKEIKSKIQSPKSKMFRI